MKPLPGSLQDLTNLSLVIALLACTPATSADLSESGNPESGSPKTEKLGRLFFTPEQRHLLDLGYARNAARDGNSSAVLTVNGIVQKHGGARTVWINGVAQSASNDGEPNPAAQTVNIPGRSQRVKLKVGERLLLGQPTSSPQGTPDK